tara:strand:+ start:1001 stop:1918 length:918 start_codon:yes stop_codon:yes gene_type:complete
MKKISFFILTFIISFSANAEKLLKDGFVDKKMNYIKNTEIADLKNKIILIFNHGQEHHDKPTKNCFWDDEVRNMASLVGEKVSDKEIMVYLFCTDDLGGDDWKRIWDKKKFKPPYKGVTKLDKRLNANLKLIDEFVEMGIPKKQIMITGFSCGGWMTMMLIAKYPEKVGGGIVYAPACYGKLTKNFKVKKIGIEKALIKFRKKNGDGPADLRAKQIDEIKKNNNLPILIFTHPMDPFDGLLTDWVEDIPNVKRIIVSENKKVNDKKCILKGKKDSRDLKDPHWITSADCFQYYNPIIKKYISSRL